MRKLTVLILLLPATLFAIEPNNVETAIAIGSRYKTEMKYVADIQTQNTICKNVFCYLFFSDFEIIAGAAARANQEMRQFTKGDVETLPLSGFTSVYVTVSGSATGGIIGAISEGMFRSHWASGNVHMVLKFGDQILQPVSKSLNGASSSTITLPIYAFWKSSPNASLLFGGPMQISNLQANFEFTYDLSPEQQSSMCEAILIDCQAKKHIEKIDLSKVLHVRPHIPKNPNLFEFKNGQSMCLDLIKRDATEYVMKDGRGILKKIPLDHVKTTRADSANPCKIQTSTVGGESLF